MEKLEKIYRGMANGAEAIDSNFQEVSKTLDGLLNDSGWQDIETMNGFKSGGFPLQYRIFQGAIHLRGRINTVTSTASKDVQFGKIPIKISQQHEWYGGVIGTTTQVRMFLSTSGALTLSPSADIGNNFQITGFDTNCLID
ncbi:hypothetical protein RCG39_09900 [Lactococcus petauri]|nr:hypothetical protein [Lactococcus petauri]PST74210.1 hypothetical protein AEH57_00745 [Lactococcus garvieae]MDC0811582.1 hypothetical protein [Lactococcus petauri]MDQ7120866.1 hypothetical protein [Lactococcus petauri]MDQ7125330.1 hypothetical protein [Lactococcus petauri]MDQ7127296.1 hypothetical protein [Lactococcus petauri]